MVVQALLCIIGTQAGRLDHSHSHQQHQLSGGGGEQHHLATAAHQQSTNKQPQAFQRANLIREGRKIEVLHSTLYGQDFFDSLKLLPLEHNFFYRFLIFRCREELTSQKQSLTRPQVCEINRQRNAEIGKKFEIVLLVGKRCILKEVEVDSLVKEPILECTHK
jgi:hypothetical protein